MALKNIVIPAGQTYGPHEKNGSHKGSGNVPDDYGIASDKGDDKITNPRK